jgi:hypothetical protein
VHLSDPEEGLAAPRRKMEGETGLALGDRTPFPSNFGFQTGE